MLEAAVIEQYICAGTVARKAMFKAKKLLQELTDPLAIDDLAPVIDDFIQAECQKYLPEITDKGLAKPCEFFARLSNEAKKDNLHIHKISFGIHFGGYPVIFANTLLPKTETESDTMGDAHMATHLAAEAVIALLGTTLMGEQVSGLEIKYVVEVIADEFDCFIAPTSYISLVSRFNYGQPGVPKSNKFVAWNNNPMPEFQVKPDEAWVIDVAMTPKDGKNSFKDCMILLGTKKRQFSVVSANYCNRNPIPEDLTKKMAPILNSCWPQRATNYGGAAELYQCIARDLLIPWIYPPVLRPCPRQATSVLLVSPGSAQSGLPTVLRLAGGIQFPPSTVGGTREVNDKTIQSLLRLKHSSCHGVAYLELHGC